MDFGTLEFLDYLWPTITLAKWQDKVELPCLIFRFRIFEGPLQVLHMCKLFYIGPFVGIVQIQNHYFSTPI
jgi:hypothetical protein